MDFVQPPPQPYADSDRINAAFDNLGEDAYGGYTNGDMDGDGYGMNGGDYGSSLSQLGARRSTRLCDAGQ